MIDLSATRPEIRFALDGDPRKTFVVTVDGLLLCAAASQTESAFRSALRNIGHVEHENRQRTLARGSAA